MKNKVYTKEELMNLSLTEFAELFFPDIKLSDAHKNFMDRIADEEEFTLTPTRLSFSRARRKGR